MPKKGRAHRKAPLSYEKKLYLIIGQWDDGIIENCEWVVAAHEDRDVAEFYAELATEEAKRLARKGVKFRSDAKNKYDPDDDFRVGDDRVDYYVREVPYIDREKLGV